MATAALSGLRKAGDVEGRREYFRALERAGMANGVHYLPLPSKGAESVPPQVGDEVEVAIDGLGALTNTIKER